MKHFNSGIAVLALVFLFANCKPKPSEAEVSKTDSISVEKSTAEKPEESKLAYFKAVGTEPFWGIEISKDSIKFTVPEKNQNFAVAFVKPNRAMDANILNYRVKMDSISLEFTVTQGDCSDGMSDKVHKYSVKGILKRADAKEQILTGCGNYIIDYRLHDIWALEEVEGKKIDPEDFKKGVPNLEIFTEEARFSGLAGCNSIGGKLFFENDLLRFTDIVTTEMMCDNFKTEKTLVKALESTTRYELKDNKLYLFNPEGTKAIFRKVD